MPIPSLKDWRESHGWTQEDAARYLGTSQVNVSRWEGGTHKIPGTALLLMHLLNDKRNRRAVEKYLALTLAK